MLNGIAFGNRVAEKIYAIETVGQDDGKVVLRALKVKPRRSTAFVVDVYNNVVGILALVPGMGAPVVLQALLADIDMVPNLLPRSKFAVLTFRPRNNDPRGFPILRPAYDPWWVKQQIKQERLSWVARLAGGMVIGTVSEKAAPYVNEQGQTIQPIQYLLQSLLGLSNGQALAVPFGTVIEVVFPEPDSPFDALLDRQDKEITTAIRNQTRVGHEAEHGSKADSGTAQDVDEIGVAHGKIALEGVLADIAQQLTVMNWPDAEDLTPTVSCSRTQQQDKADTWTAVGALQTSEYLAPSQIQDLDAEMGLTVRTDSEVEILMKKLEQSAEPPPAPMIPGKLPLPEQTKPTPKPGEKDA